jgi:hypothetical protein
MCSYVIKLSNKKIVAVMTIADADAATDNNNNTYLQFYTQRILMWLG